MRVLVVGSGGREHAIVRAILKSPLLDKLYCAPGNAGMEADAQCVDIKVMDFSGIIEFCSVEAIDFVIVGPEDPLVGGLVDELEKNGITAFGPSALAARLEGSKTFTKELCMEKGIPTAKYERFTEIEAAEAYIEKMGAPIVIKSDGLTAGKGVVVAETVEDALAAAREMMAGKYGESSLSLVIEECLIGEEGSFFALSDGDHVLPLIGAQDHKRAYDGDTGPNTGGMGAYTPTPILDAAACEQLMEVFIKPTVEALREMGNPYRGVIYLGLMMTADGPKLIEYNCRFGDPECQVILPRLKSDLLAAMLACTDGTLDRIRLEWSDETVVNVVMATKGYPTDYKTGSIIRGLAAVDSLDGIDIIHSGTEMRGHDVHAVGGRVLNVVARGSSVSDAVEHAYGAIEQIDWPEGYCRSDIGWRAIEREKAG